MLVADKTRVGDTSSVLMVVLRSRVGPVRSACGTLVGGVWHAEKKKDKMNKIMNVGRKFFMM